jgi:hypothetical protein
LHIEKEVVVLQKNHNCITKKREATVTMASPFLFKATLYLPAALRLSAAGWPIIALIRRTPAEELSSF